MLARDTPPPSSRIRRDKKDGFGDVEEEEGEGADEMVITTGGSSRDVDEP